MRARSAEIFFEWYNEQHYHSGIALLTPSTVHYGLSEECLQQRADVLAAAYVEHPERFVNGAPKALPLPNEVWINKPTMTTTAGEQSATVDSVIILPSREQPSHL